MGLCRCQGKSGDELLETIPHILTLLESSYPGVQVQSDANHNIYITKGEAEPVRERLDRIATWHSRETGPGGMVGDFCVTCDGRWPCDTRRMAEGAYANEEDAP